MSEDATTIKCKINKSLLSQAEEIITEYKKSTSANNSEIQFSRGKLESKVEFSDFDEECISRLNSKLTSLGAEKVQIEFYFEQTNESNYYQNIGSEFKGFSSLNEVKQSLKDLENTIDLTSFNFGKEGKEHTAIIRLLVTAKSKKSKICEVFENTKLDFSDAVVENFSENFKTVINQNATGFIGLCDSAFHGTKPWQPLFRDLIKSIKFSHIQGDYIYIGFVLDNINFKDYSESEFIEILPLLFDRVDGVKKSWVKFKLKGSKNKTNDIFVRWPGNHEGGPVSEEQKKSVSTDFDTWEGTYS